MNGAMAWLLFFIFVGFVSVVRAIRRAADRIVAAINPTPASPPASAGWAAIPRNPLPPPPAEPAPPDDPATAKLRRRMNGW